MINSPLVFVQVLKLYRLKHPQFHLIFQQSYHVAIASSNKEFKIGRIFLGLLIVIGGLMALSSSPLVGIVLALIGVGIFGSGIITVFSYERNGIEKQVYLPFFEANHVAEFEEQVLAEIAKFYDDRNVRKHAQENAQTIVDGLRDN